MLTAEGAFYVPDDNADGLSDLIPLIAEEDLPCLYSEEDTPARR